ncbi:hypothetical protein Sm713_20050 [Streptomyces sp. TS71-3]|nr:hypothetical protein Sm713_20050 [Streptomyces sp. TS71-3]
MVTRQKPSSDLTRDCAAGPGPPVAALAVEDTTLTCYSPSWVTGPWASPVEDRLPGLRGAGRPGPVAAAPGGRPAGDRGPSARTRWLFRACADVRATPYRPLPRSYVSRIARRIGVRQNTSRGTRT